MLGKRVKWENSIRIVRHGFLLMLLLWGTVEVGYGQTRTYLTGEVNPPSNGGLYDLGVLGAGGAKLVGANNARNSNEGTSAVLRAEKLIALGLPLGQGNVRLHIRGSGNGLLQRNRPVYFTLKEKPVTDGLSVDLGTLLGLVEAVSIKGELFNGALDPYPGGISIFDPPNPYFGTRLTNTNDRILIDKTGDFFLSVTPPLEQDFNAARLSIEMPSSLLTVVDVSYTELEIYNVFQLSEGGFCDLKPIFTDPGEQSGLNLDLSSLKLLNLGEILTDPESAIDDDMESYSELSPGLLSIGNYVAQTFFFNHLASTSDGVRFRVSLPAGLLELSLLSNITFQAFNGSNPVGTSIPLNQDILGVDLLGIPLAGSNYTVPIDIIVRPNVSFDRIKVKFNSALGVGGDLIGGSVKIHDVSLAPSVPKILEAGQPDDVDICEGETASFQVTATVPQGTLSYQWQVWDGTSWQSVVGETSSILNIPNVPLEFDGNQYRVQITGGNIECPQTIYSDVGKLNVSISPGKPHLTISDVIN